MRKYILYLLVVVGLIGRASASVIYSYDFSNFLNLQIPPEWTSVQDSSYPVNAVIEKNPINNNLTALSFSEPTIAAHIQLPAIDISQYLNSEYNIGLGFSIYYEGSELGKSGILIGGSFSGNNVTSWFVGDYNPGNPNFIYLDVPQANSWYNFKFDITQSINSALLDPDANQSTFSVAFEDWAAYLESPTTKPYIGLVTLSAEAIPEPSTYALFGIGAIGVLMVMRRKKAV